ncbi:hypothetical protein HPE56_01195 [Maribacter sp. ANRC-HE7]|uniref:Uncharacterized protein n=1 Tax=Maribacter aquimaris TaxID=2737171 RepID=A0ABR7UW85_9FLAO|nr:hypothetical protein [Maribacter aquimaris]
MKFREDLVVVNDQITLLFVNMPYEYKNGPRASFPFEAIGKLGTYGIRP